MRFFPRKQRIYSAFMRGTAGLTLGTIVYAFTLGDIQAQTFRQFNESRSRMDSSVDRATRLQNEQAWQNYINLGVATERAQWEQEAQEELLGALKEIEQSEKDEATKETEMQAVVERFNEAAEDWNREAEEYTEEERGSYLAERETISVTEVAAERYEEIIAAAEAAVAGTADVDLSGWEAAIAVDHGALVAAFEAELQGQLDRARANQADLEGTALQGFEAELAKMESAVRREFEVRDSFYVTRARNRYIALKRGDDLNARLESEENSAESIGENIIAGTLESLGEETTNMLAAAEAETENLTAGADSPDFEAAGLNWEARMEDMIDAGLRKWEHAEEDLYARRLAWQQENQRSREEAARIWQSNHDELLEARDAWLAEIQVTIRDGRAQWESKIAEFRANREKAELELTEYIAKEKERWNASSQELSDMVNGGGAALLEAKDAYRYYDNLLGVLSGSSAGGSRDQELYNFYQEQRDYMRGAVSRFQGILSSAEGVLNLTMHSGEDHTGLLNDVRHFAGDLPDAVKALDENDYETGLKNEMASRDEDFVLYRRDIESIIDNNALFVKRAEDLESSGDFDYAAAGSVDELRDLVGAVDRKYDDHRRELLELVDQDREGLDDPAKLAAIKSDIDAWMELSTEKDRRLKKETVAYFNASQGGYYLTGNEGDPFLMTRAEYEWELLRRERNHLAKKLERAEAVKEYADLAFQHDAGLEMAAVTAERSEVAKVHADLREISYMLIRGELQLAPEVYNDPAVRDAEFNRILNERGIDRATLDAREATINDELSVLTGLLGVSGQAEMSDLTGLVTDIDAYLEANLELEARGEHPLGIVREKLIKYRNRLEAGADPGELTDSWTAITGGARVLRDQIQLLKNDYDFDGLRAEFATIQAQVDDETLVMIRGDLAEIKERIEANKELLEQAKDRLDLAKEAYRQARIDFDVLRAGNSEDLIRIDLLNTTSSLGRVIQRMTKVEGVPGFEGVYDPLTARRIEYLNEVSQNTAAKTDLATSQEALSVVQGLEDAKVRLAKLEEVLDAGGLDGLSATDLGDRFLNARADLIDTAAADENSRSLDPARTAMDALAGHHGQLADLRTALDAATAGTDAAEIEIARRDLAAAEEGVRRGVERLIAGIRGEERARREALFYYLNSTKADGTPLVDPEKLQAETTDADQSNFERSIALGQAAAAEIETFLNANYQDTGGNYQDFATLLKKANDRYASALAGRTIDTGGDYGKISVAADEDLARARILRDWLITNRAALEYAGKEPGEGDDDARGPPEKWDSLLKYAESLRADSEIYSTLSAATPTTAGDPWVSAFRTGREALAVELETMLAGADADLPAALEALSAEQRDVLYSYGGVHPTLMRQSLEANLGSLRLDLSRVEYDFKAIYLREKQNEYKQEMARVQKELAPLQTKLNAAITERAEHRAYARALTAEHDGETDPARKAALQQQIDDLNTAIGELSATIASVQPGAENLSRELQRLAALARETTNLGSSAPLYAEARQEYYLADAGLALLREGIQLTGKETSRRQATEQNMGAADRIKAVIGFYATNPAGEILRDGAGEPLISAEFQAMGITDPDADLAELLSGDRTGTELSRWAGRLREFAGDEDKKSLLDPEVGAALDMLEGAILQVLTAKAFIDNRYSDGPTALAQAKAEKELAMERLVKAGLVLDLERKLSEALTAARNNKQDPVDAALAILEHPDNVHILNLYAGYDKDGASDGIADPIAQEKLDELLRLSARLREARLQRRLGETAAAYAQYQGQFVEFARTETDALRPEREAYWNTLKDLRGDDTRAAIEALPDDETFRAKAFEWAAAAPPETRAFRGAVLEALSDRTLKGLSGAELRDAVLARIDALNDRIQDQLDASFAESERISAREADLQVTGAVEDLIGAYAGRATRAKDLLGPALAGIADGDPLGDAKVAIKTELDELSALPESAAYAGIRREVLGLLTAATDTADLKTKLGDYLDGLADPAAAELDQLQDELYASSLRRSLGVFAATSEYDAEQYPAELQELLLVRGYQQAEQRYADYKEQLASPAAAVRDAAALNLTGINGSLADDILLRDFLEYQAGASAADYRAANEKPSLGAYAQEYLLDRNTGPERLPRSGMAVFERLGLEEYARIQNAVAGSGVGVLNEEEFFAEFQDYVLALKAHDWADTNAISLTGLTLEERRANFEADFESFLNDPAYAVGGKTLGRRIIGRAERERFFTLTFAALETGAEATEFLPDFLSQAASENRLSDPLSQPGDSLPAELTAIADYATADWRRMAGAVSPETAAALARVEVTALARGEDLAMMSDDAELAGVVDRAGYDGASAELRGELIELLREQRRLRQADSATSAAQALQALRTGKVMRHHFATDAAEKELEVFGAAEGKRLARIEDKFFTELSDAHAELKTAANQDRGEMLRALVERSRGGTTPFYDALAPELKTELDRLKNTLFGGGAGALSASEIQTLRDNTDEYALLFQVKADRELASSGYFEAAEGTVLAFINRAASDEVRAAARADKNRLTRAFIETIYKNDGRRTDYSAETAAWLGATPGMAQQIEAAAGEMSSNLRDTLLNQAVLIERFLAVFLEDQQERTAMEELLTDPARLNPDAALSLEYAAHRDLSLLQVEEAELIQSLYATAADHNRFFAERRGEYEERVAVSGEMVKWAQTLRKDGSYRTSRYAQYRTFIGVERQYQDNNLSESERRGEILEQISLADKTGDGIYNDPEALLNRADWESMLVSDKATMEREVFTAEGEPVQIRAVYSVSSNAARNFGAGDAAEEAELRSTYFEHLANNYLDKISKLNGVLNTIWTAGRFADERRAKGRAALIDQVRANYDPDAGSNDISALKDLKIDAQSRLAIHNEAKINEVLGQIQGDDKGYDKAGTEYAQAGRRNQIRTMKLLEYLRKTYYAIEAEMKGAEAVYNTHSNIAESLRQEFAGRNRDLADGLSEMASRWRDFQARNNEFDLRSYVQEYAETPYLFASEADSDGDEEGDLIAEYRGDALEEYERALAAVNLLNEQMKEAAYKLNSEDKLEDFNAIIAGLDAGRTYPPLTDADRERLLELRDRKFNEYEELSPEDQAELTLLTQREMYERYGDLITARAEHIKHTMRMVRLHKANEIIQDEIMRRRMIADEKRKQFESVLANNFGSFEGDEGATESRNAVYARLAGLVEGGGSFFNEFRSWYWRGQQWADDAYSSYEGASMGALKLAPTPQFWPTQMMDGIAGIAGAQSINKRDRDAIGAWMGYGGSLAEWSGFQSTYYQALVAMGLRDMKLLIYQITVQVWTPILIAGSAMVATGTAMMAAFPIGSWAGALLVAAGTPMVTQSTMTINQALLDYQMHELLMRIMYINAYNTAQKGSTQEVMAAQREYEDAQAALYYFTRIPDQQTLKDRVIQYGAHASDDPNDNSGESLYKVTEEDLIYLFDKDEAGNKNYLKSDGSNNDPTDEQVDESLDITGMKEQVEFRDAFNRRYDPDTLTDGKPGELEGGYYWSGNDRYTRLRFFRHDGSTYYRYAKVIDEDDELHDVYNMGSVLKNAVPHGDAIRADRFAKYKDEGEQLAQAAQDKTLILEERDQTYENLFRQAAGHREGGQEFTGYRMTYKDYRANSDEVYQNELGQRQAVQMKEWELRERELVDRFQAWEARVHTILDRGRRSWSRAEDRFLQKKRQWEREFDQDVEKGHEEWDKKIKEHFTNKENWENDVRAKASEATIEKVLGESVDQMNAQFAKQEQWNNTRMGRINRTATINAAIADMRRDMPSGLQKLKKVNANISKFNTQLSIANMTGADFGGDVAGLATQFRGEMKEHKHRMKIMANVKIFEQYRMMMADFVKSFEVQNKRIDNQTSTAALSQGYFRKGDKFLKMGASSSAVGVVDAYKYFDVQGVLDAELAKNGFAQKSGKDLVGFLKNSNQVEVEAYFYTQKLALQAAMEVIRGTDPSANTRDAKVIGAFNAWVGKASSDPTMGHSQRLMGNTGAEHRQQRDLAFDIATSGFGELGQHGRRPGGAPFGFYVQLGWMSGEVAKQDAQGMADQVGTLDPVSQTINQLNPYVMLANSVQNVEIASQVHGKERGYMWEAQALSMVKAPLKAVGNIAMGAGVAMIATGGLSWAGAGLVGAGMAASAVANSINVDPKTGERSFKMDGRAAAQTAMDWINGIAGAALPGFATAISLGTQAAMAGFEWDEKGNQKGGWSLEGARGDRLAGQLAVGALSSGISEGISGTGIGAMMNKVGATGIAVNTFSEYAKKQMGIENNYDDLRHTGLEGLGGFAATAISHYGNKWISGIREEGAKAEALKKMTPEERAAHEHNKNNQKQRQKEIIDAYAARDKNRGFFTKFAQGVGGYFGLNKESIGNWIDGDGYVDNKYLNTRDGLNKSSASLQGMVDKGDIKNVTKEQHDELKKAQNPKLSHKERADALKRFNDIEFKKPTMNSTQAAHLLISKLNANGVMITDWAGLHKKLGGRGKVSAEQIDKLYKSLCRANGANPLINLDQAKVDKFYKHHVKQGQAWRKKQREIKRAAEIAAVLKEHENLEFVDGKFNYKEQWLKDNKFSPHQIKQIRSGEKKIEEVGPPGAVRKIETSDMALSVLSMAGSVAEIGLGIGATILTGGLGAGLGVLAVAHGGANLYNEWQNFSAMREAGGVGAVMDFSNQKGSVLGEAAKWGMSQVTSDQDWIDGAAMVGEIADGALSTVLTLGAGSATAMTRMSNVVRAVRAGRILSRTPVIRNLASASKLAKGFKVGMTATNMMDKVSTVGSLSIVAGQALSGVYDSFLPSEQSRPHDFRQLWHSAAQLGAGALLGKYGSKYVSKYIKARPASATTKPGSFKDMGESAFDLNKNSDLAGIDGRHGREVSNGFPPTGPSRREILRMHLNDVTATGANRIKEIRGIIYTTRRMEQLGFELLPQPMHHNDAGHGLDLPFRHGGDGRLAVAEAKHGEGLGKLETDVQGYRQGGHPGNLDRLEKLRDYQQSRGEDTSLTDEMIEANNNGQLESYAGFFKWKRLYQLDFDDLNHKFGRSQEGATLIP